MKYYIPLHVAKMRNVIYKNKGLIDKVYIGKGIHSCYTLMLANVVEKKYIHKDAKICFDFYPGFENLHSMFLYESEKNILNKNNFTEQAIAMMIRCGICSGDNLLHFRLVRVPM